MSEILNEQLSALLDGELPPEETQLLLKRLGRDPERCARRMRYIAAGAVLRGARYLPRGDFAERVSAALAAEPARPRPLRPLPTGWLRPLAGLAVAAAVAGVAIALLPRAAMAPGPSVASVAAPAARLATVPTVRSRAASGAVEPASYVTPQVNPRGLNVIPRAELARYVVAHSAVSTPLTGRSMLTSLIAEPPADESPAGESGTR